MDVIITLSEYTDFIYKTLGLKKSVDFYRNLAQAGKLENAFLNDTGRWFVKVKRSIYQSDDIEKLVEENIKLKEKIESIQKICS